VELQYFGGNCVKLTTKKATLTIDDNLTGLGQKPVTKPDDITVLTYDLGKDKQKSRLTIDVPGEYEASDVSIQGIAARAHTDEPGKKSATIFKIIADDLRVAVLGHIYPELNDQQLEALGTIDILVVPVGGNGFTLDAIGALKLIKKIEPKLVIPTNYADKAVKYEVPAQSLDDAVKELAMEPKEKVAKLKIKPAELTDTAQLVILERQ